MCPHCPNQVREAAALAVRSDRVQLTVVDAEAHPDLAVQCGARSVPLTLIDRDLGLVGAVPAETLAEHILNRGTAAHRQVALTALVENARTEEAVVRLEDPGYRRALAELWRTSVLSSRMGLMMLAEEALEGREDLLDDIVSELLPLLDAKDDGLRGDTVDLLAAIAHPDATGALRSLRNDPDEDIAEAAEEALEAIADRAG
jgi:thioredoxin-like negative regulator of GroEL